MALQGINMPLMPLGMEALLATTFTSLGLQPSQLEDFFPGPAFLAWVSTFGLGLLAILLGCIPAQHEHVSCSGHTVAKHPSCMQVQGYMQRAWNSSTVH